jgi:hypothetical protein
MRVIFVYLSELHSQESKSERPAVAPPLAAGHKKRKKKFVFPAKSTFHGLVPAQEGTPLEQSQEMTTENLCKKQKIIEQSSKFPKHVLLRSCAF